LGKLVKEISFKQKENDNLIETNEYLRKELADLTAEGD